MISKIPLVNGGFTIVDTEDLPKVVNFKWKYRPGMGVVTYGQNKKTALFLHHLVCPHKYVTAIDGNKRNACKANLSFRGSEICEQGNKFLVRRVVLVGRNFANLDREFHFSEDNRIKVKREAQAFKTALFNIPNQEFVDCVLNGKELDLNGGWIKEGDVIKIPLPDKTYALIDSKYERTARQYNWRYHKNSRRNSGVITSVGGQFIQLHNLISPHKKVTHINADKRDCKLSNLKRCNYDFIRNYLPKRIINITLWNNVYRIRRKATDSKGKKYEINYAWYFGKRAKYKTKKAAYAAAKEKWKIVKDLTDEQVIELSKAIAPTKTTNEIISDWDIWGGKEVSMNECIEMGIKTNIYA